MGLLNVKRINKADLRVKAHRFLSSTAIARGFSIAAAFALLTGASAAHAQSTTCDGRTVDTFAFSGSTLLSGTDLQPGAIYGFSNVAPGIDGRVEVVSFNNGAVLLAIDNDAGAAGSLQPELDPNPAGGGFVTLQVSFINATTGAPETVDVSATQIDVDGNNQTLREFVEFEDQFVQFTLDNPTSLALGASGPGAPNRQRFEATTSTVAPGIDPTATQNMARANYFGVTGFEYAIGTVGAGPTNRLTSLNFECPSLPNPVTNSGPGAITASADGISSPAGATNVLNVFDNDTFGGSPVIPADVTLTTTTPDPTGNISLNPDGSVDVAPGTPGGTYTITYQICETAYATECSQAVVTVTVPSAPELGVSKSASAPVANGNGTFNATYSVIIENTGNVAVNNLQIEDDMAAQMGTSFVASDATIPYSGVVSAPTVTLANTSGNSVIPTVNTAYDGGPAPELLSGADGSLEPGDQVTVTFTVVLNPNASGAPSNFENQAEGSGDDPAGTSVTDASDDGSDPAVNPGETTGSPTAVNLTTTLPDTVTLPGQCGAFTSAGWVTNGQFGVHDTQVQFNSGDPKTDPYIYLPLNRDSSGRIVSYFGPSDENLTGVIPNQAGTNLATSRNTDVGHESEYHWSVFRMEGVPGSTLTADLDTQAAQEYTAYWVEDSSGAVIDAGDFAFTTPASAATPTGVGQSIPISVTVPADGIIYLHAGIFDPTVAYGRPVISNYEGCPIPEFELTKLADDDADRAVGDTITYTYTAENTGNIDISDVTVTDVHNGSGTLSPITINALTNTSGDSSDDAADNDIDVLAPGDSVTFEATYVVTVADVTAGSDITNMATLTGVAAAGTLTNPTASESVSLLTPTPLPPPLPPLDPGVCGGVLAEAYLLDGMGIGGEQSYQLASSSPTHDPDVFFGTFGAEPAYIKNADGSVEYYFDGEAPLQSVSTDVNTPNSIGNISAVAGGAADQTDAAEFWRVTARVDGVPGETYNYTLDNGNAHEFIHYWVEDSAGNVIDSTLGDANTANGWLYGTGATASTSSANGATSITAAGTTPVSYTIPASSPDGIAYLRVMVLDPQVGWGRLNFSNAPECPLPEIALTKVADDNTDRAIGDTITYTYTAENTGNIDIADVTVTDVHNGSGSLSPITIDVLTNTSGDSSDDAADNAVDVLAPGDSVTFEASYVVTEADALAGAAVTNTATATGTPPVGAFTDSTASESVTIAPIEADLSITKTNTAGVNGEADQAADTLTSGDVTTYTLTVTNNGPDGMSGAVVTDVVGSGLTCAGADAVSLTGDGVPAGSFTIADLTGGGITLARLEDTESTTMTYSCTVD